jgi:MarC family membrane protein
MYSADIAISAFTTLIVVLDPVGLIPIFLSLTAAMTTAERRETAVWATILACGVLLFFALLGKELLGALGITLPAFRIAGGCLLFYTGFEMVFGQRHARQQQQSGAAPGYEVKSIAAFPLAIPMMAGPGAITACILLAGQAAGQPAAQFALVGVILAACAATYLCFIAAEPLDRLLGQIGKIVLTRLLGVLLAALAVQFTTDGILEIARTFH